MTFVRFCEGISATTVPVLLVQPGAKQILASQVNETFEINQLNFYIPNNLSTPLHNTLLFTAVVALEIRKGIWVIKIT